NLNFVPCVLFKWNSSGILEWKWHSKNFFDANFGYSFRKGEFGKLLRGSATEKILKGEISSSELFLETGTTASEWFPKIRNMSFKNHLLIEQATSLGQFGILTIL